MAKAQDQEVVSPTKGKNKHTLNKGRAARSAAPPPSIRARSEPLALETENMSENARGVYQRHRSNAPSPSVGLVTLPTSAPGHGQRINDKTGFERIAMSSHSRVARERSMAPSPSPSSLPRPSRTAAAQRTFRSSAPSPDRSLSKSCTPPASETQSESVPPARTPVSGSKGESNTSNNCTAPFSSNSAGRLISARNSLPDNSDEEMADSDNSYNPSLDPVLQEMYRQITSSVTNTVSVTNAPMTSLPAEEEKTWNPPQAPKAMKSHMITWINDKKVGERINGVQVDFEDDEDEKGGIGTGKSGKNGGGGGGMGAGIGMGLKKEAKDRKGHREWTEKLKGKKKAEHKSGGKGDKKA